MLALSVGMHEPALSQDHDPTQWGTDAPVLAMQAAGDTLFIGGKFSAIGPVSGGGGILDSRTGQALNHSPRVAGRIRAAVPDGQGGWYVGGTFSAIGGVARSNLAHILADGSVDDWNPVVDGSPIDLFPRTIDRPFVIDVVSALARSGDWLFIGGNFSRVGGRDHCSLAALDLRSGQVSSWNLDADGFVCALVADAGRVYVGGSFSHVAGQPRSRLAGISTRTGGLLAWSPGADGTVFSLTSANRTVFAGGEFDSVGGRPRNSLAAITAESGVVTDWDAALLPTRYYAGQGNWSWPWVTALAVRGQTIYVGGRFAGLGGAARRNLGALDVRTAEVAPFDPSPEAPVLGLTTGGQKLYAAGVFYTIQGQSRRHAAALQLPGGELLAWSPYTRGTVSFVSPGPAGVLVGGYFRSICEWVDRSAIAALDARSGRLLPWNPGSNGAVRCMLVHGDRLLVGGDFGWLAGQARHHLAAFERGTGRLLPWVPGISNTVLTLAANDTSVFVGGTFLSADEVASRGIAAIDAESGHITAWRAQWLVWPEVTAIALLGDHLFVGGRLYAHSPDFTQIRNVLVDLNSTSGAWSPWNPVAGPPYSLDYDFEELATRDGRVYAAGRFHELGGTTRDGIAVLDTSLGRALPWDPEQGSGAVDGRTVSTIAFSPDGLFVGGSFSRFGNQPRSNLAELDLQTGVVRPWAPSVSGGNRYDGAVADLCLAGGRLYVGGALDVVDGSPCSGFTSFRLQAMANPGGSPGVAKTPGRALHLAPPVPNPAVERTMIRFELPEPGLVSVELYDVQGRRAAAPLEHVTLAAGPHSVSVEVGDQRPGVYFCRLSANGTMLTRRLLIVH
jgi:hypothetical protein